IRGAREGHPEGPVLTESDTVPPAPAQKYELGLSLRTDRALDEKEHLGQLQGLAHVETLQDDFGGVGADANLDRSAGRAPLRDLDLAHLRAGHAAGHAAGELLRRGAADPFPPGPI